MGADDEVLPGQTAIDDADFAAGYRSVVDDEETGELPDSDPNVAAGAHDYDHENHIGEEVDGGDVAAAGADLDRGGVG